MNEVILKATDGLELSCLYKAVDNPKACIQIIHGMVEHKERYIPFINILNKNGYSVIISDNRGHGKSINEKYPLGHIGDYHQMIADQYEVTKYIKEQNLNKKLYIFAHSMGTLIARNYLMQHDNEIEKLILCGTVPYNKAVNFGIFLSKLHCIGKGKYKHSKILYAFTNDMSFKDDVHWISYNENNIKDYISDPLCSFKFDNFGNLNLFNMVKNLHKFKKFSCHNKELKILSLSGTDDRTTGGTKELVKTMKALNKIGYSNTNFIEYPKMKHEILNEENNNKVIKDILDFFE